uniref:Uncharacterized LOC103391479 n=1 Tax=Cynoglossus semilaevis TaxID=244447 RepID=A0A3P8W159_CYNSE
LCSPSLLLFDLLISPSLVSTAHDGPSSPRVVSVNVGDEVTLKCSREHSLANMFYWYKQNFKELQLVSTFYKHTEKGKLVGEWQKNERFSVETTNYKNHLTISDVQFSDAATYHCMSGSLVTAIEYLEGIRVTVTESDSPIPVPQGAAENIQREVSVNTNCTVEDGAYDGNLKANWFRNTADHQLGLIYTKGDSGTQNQTCAYSVLTKSLVFSDAGTYACAVASCAHILFEKKSRLNFIHDSDLTYILSGALTLTSVLNAFLCGAVYRMYKTNICCCLDSTREISAPSTTNEEGYGDEENLHYAALSVHNRTRRRMDNVENDCVYSSVRH